MNEPDCMALQRKQICKQTKRANKLQLCKALQHHTLQNRIFAVSAVRPWFSLPDTTEGVKSRASSRIVRRMCKTCLESCKLEATAPSLDEHHTTNRRHTTQSSEALRVTMHTNGGNLSHVRGTVCAAWDGQHSQSDTHTYTHSYAHKENGMAGKARLDMAVSLLGKQGAANETCGICCTLVLYLHKHAS